MVKHENCAFTPVAIEIDERTASLQEIWVGRSRDQARSREGGFVKLDELPLEEQARTGIEIGYTEDDARSLIEISNAKDTSFCV